MAITFIAKQKKKMRTMTAVLAVSVLSSAVIIWQGFFAGPKPVASITEIGKGEPFIVKTTKIDLNVLEDPILKELTPFKEIPAVGEFGRENPFLPY
ncbi:MAG: hypothetical protein V1705_00120 [bacterium]